MATVGFGNAAVDMRLTEAGYGVPALQVFETFLVAFLPISETVLVNTPTQIVVRQLDASGNAVTVTAQGNFTIGLINSFSIEAAGVIVSYLGNFQVNALGDVFGTLTESTAVVAQDRSLIGRFSGLNAPLFLSSNPLPDFADDDTLLAGADIISGGAGNDYLLGYAGNDQIAGGLGDDTIDGGLGSDNMMGGLGNDNYVLDNTGDIVNESFNQGVDTVIIAVTYGLGNNVENLTLTGGAPANGTGNGANNVLIGNAGANSLLGLDGDDVLDGGLGADLLDGGAGNDIFVVDTPLDTVLDGGGIDSVVSSINYTLGAGIENLTLIGNALAGTGSAGGNLIIGNSGDNSLIGRDGNDTIYGGSGKDTIQGDQNFTTLAGNDVILSEAGDDVVFGGPGDDVMALGAGFDTAIGEGGNDAINGEGGNDAIDGGDGNDTLLGWDDQDILFGSVGGDILYGGNGDDIMMGNRGDPNDPVDGVDLMFGDAGQDTIHGGAGDDGIFGGTGNDVIDGGLGNDAIIGGEGAEIMLGSGPSAFGVGTAGDDIFVYNSVAEVGDSIYGFDTRAGNQDRIFLNTLFDAVGYTGTTPRADGYLYVLQGGLDTVIFIDADGASGGANLTQLVTLIGTTAATVTDSFFLFQ